VLVFNQRSLAEIFEVLGQVAALVGAPQRGHALLLQFRERLGQMRRAVQARLAAGAGRACILRNGTRRRSAASAGCPS
jgi:ABC-type hemin transport system substrate-binding protein